MSGLPVLDREHLSAMVGNDNALEAEIMALFLASAETYLTDLGETTDHDVWRRLAHTLKGSASAIGARRLADQARHVETTPMPAADGRAAVLRALAIELDAIKLQYSVE